MSIILPGKIHVCQLNIGRCVFEFLVEAYLLQKLLEEAEKRRQQASELVIDDVISDDITVAESDVIKMNSSSNSSIAVSLPSTPEATSRKKSADKNIERKKTTNGGKQKNSSAETGISRRNTMNPERSAETKSPRVSSALSKAEHHMTTLKE
jgi:hypothetical protein